jgi:hypothetical protein
MAESRYGRRDNGAARLGPDRVFGHLPPEVEEAQFELNRLMASLAGEADAPVVPHKLRRDAHSKGVDARPVEPSLPAAKQSSEAGLQGEPSPVYVIVSSRKALTDKYGQNGFERLDLDLHDLKQAVEAGVGIEAIVLYVDDEASLRPFDVDPVDGANPYKVKILIDSVDEQLVGRGQRIRYLLIVGGDRIIPFHRLPNPVEDQDALVHSDNPYACRDGNYLVPDRAIGRLPDEESDGPRPSGPGADGSSLRFLHSVIQTAADAHRTRATSKGLLEALYAALHFLRMGPVNGRGLGYSASIWRKASRAVFLTIGDDSQLRTSPPLTYEGFRVVDRPHFTFFNLHGIEDGPNWYGQRDALFPADYPLFPLALRPQDLRMDEYAGSVVLTEACYGANILGKTAVDSIALRLLAARALAVVGSTKVSYGSIAPPLLGADLIGKYFWEGLRARLGPGDALKYAKVSLAQEMQRRQGYLDGEDQKALISFVLYGDPLLPTSAVDGRVPAMSLAKSLCPPIICGRESDLQDGVVSDDLVASVKGQIETSLPHMKHARVRAKSLGVCRAAPAAACKHPGAGGGFGGRSGRWSVMLQKDLPVESELGTGACLPLHQVVRAIVDENGRIVKLALSK